MQVVDFGSVTDGVGTNIENKASSFSTEQDAGSIAQAAGACGFTAGGSPCGARGACEAHALSNSKARAERRIRGERIVESLCLGGVELGELALEICGLRISCFDFVEVVGLGVVRCLQVSEFVRGTLRRCHIAADAIPGTKPE